ESREARGVRRGFDVDGTCGVPERSNWIRGAARAALDAHDVRERLPAADSGVRAGRRDFDRGGGHCGAHRGGAHGIARWRDDGARGRSCLHLSHAAESAMSAPEERASIASPAVAIAATQALRLKVEQASYAYAAADRSAPKFTLGPASFEAQQHEMVAILG